MVPLQAVHIVSNWASNTQHAESYSLTELLLDDLEDLLLVEFLGKTLDRGQGLTAIALCEKKKGQHRSRKQLHMLLARSPWDDAGQSHHECELECHLARERKALTVRGDAIGISASREPSWVLDERHRYGAR